MHLKFNVVKERTRQLQFYDVVHFQHLLLNVFKTVSTNVVFPLKNLGLDVTCVQVNILSVAGKIFALVARDKPTSFLPC
jgi:hypothetical protein